MKLNVSFPANGSQKLIEIEDERKLRVFMDKRYDFTLGNGGCEICAMDTGLRMSHIEPSHTRTSRTWHRMEN